MKTANLGSSRVLVLAVRAVLVVRVKENRADRMVLAGRKVEEDLLVRVDALRRKNVLSIVLNTEKNVLADSSKVDRNKEINNKAVVLVDSLVIRRKCGRV